MRVHSLFIKYARRLTMVLYKAIALGLFFHFVSCRLAARHISEWSISNSQTGLGHGSLSGDLPKLQKRTPGNCIGKLCSKTDESTTNPPVNQENQHSGNSRSSRAQIQSSWINRVRSAQLQHSASRGDDEAVRPPRSRSDTLPDRVSSSTSLGAQSNSIASLTATLRQSSSHALSQSLPRVRPSGGRSEPLSVAQPSTPYYSPRRNEMRSESLSLAQPSTPYYSPRRSDMRSPFRDISYSGNAAARTSGESSRSRPPRPPLDLTIDLPGPSSFKSQSSYTRNYSPEHDLRLARATRGWTEIMTAHSAHQWDQQMKSGFEQRVREHVEPFRTGEISESKINALKERHQAHVKNLLASEVAMHHIIRSIPEHAAYWPERGLVLARANDHAGMERLARNLEPRPSRRPSDGSNEQRKR